MGLLVLFLPVGYAILMRPNKAETAVHGCHYPNRVIWPCACQTVGWCLSASLPLIVWKQLLLFSIVSNVCQLTQDDPPLRCRWKLNDPSLTKGSKTDNSPPLCSRPPPVLFDQSLKAEFCCKSYTLLFRILLWNWFGKSYLINRSDFHQIIKSTIADPRWGLNNIVDL